MSKVFVSVSVTLDGFLAPAGDGLLELGPDHPRFQAWLAQWSRLQAWALELRFFRENLQLGDGGVTGPDNQLAEEIFARTGVTIIGKRMFDGGEKHWPEEAPFHTPVFVLTHQVRAPWERPGGTTFHFVNDGPEAALRRAREVAGGRDIRIGGGANVIQQYLDAGLVDELHLAVAPVLFGEGIRLFERIDPARFGFRISGARASKLATFLRYDRAG
jgi:dihydrofolate reductase